MTVGILDSIEKSYRSRPKPPVRKLGLKECISIFSLVFVCAPFITAICLILPIMGQVVTILAVTMLGLYLYARRSWQMLFLVIFSYLVFLAPTLIFMQQLKYRLELVLFFLLAGGIPVSIIFTLVMAYKFWVEAEYNYSNVEGH